MIKIIKKTIEVDENQFKKELQELAKLVYKNNPSLIALSFKYINSSFGTKLTNVDFYRLNEKLNIKVWRGEFFMISDLIK